MLEINIMYVLICLWQSRYAFNVNITRINNKVNNLRFHAICLFLTLCYYKFDNLFGRFHEMSICCEVTVREAKWKVITTGALVALAVVAFLLLLLNIPYIWVSYAFIILRRYSITLFVLLYLCMFNVLN